MLPDGMTSISSFRWCQTNMTDLRPGIVPWLPCLVAMLGSLSVQRMGSGFCICNLETMDQLCAAIMLW